MKKRFISMLLMVLMVMSLFSGMTVSASAAQYNGANTIEYTMAQGDFVLRICQRLGLNYYTCKDAIMILNNIYDGQWNQLTVGRTLILPASDYDAVLIANGAKTTANTSGAAATTASTSNVTGTASTATATTLNAANTASSSADVLGYYLVPYTMSYGETVSGVCNAMGVNFSIFGPFVKQVNNVSNWKNVRAGDTLIIPTPMAPAVGSTCYGVMEHIVTSSDTAYGIVTSKGINYNANERLLKVLNQTENLAAVNAGQKFFYAVPLTVTVPGTANPGSTATTTTTTTVTDGNGTTTTQTTTTAKLYGLTSGMAASDGTMLFYVGTQPVTAAAAGARVTIVTSTNAGKAIQSLTVKHANGTADLHLSGDTFIMPSCDVRVDADITLGHDINISANYSGKATATVGGISVQSAVKGATVIMKSADPNYEISAVYASYKKLVSASTKTPISVSSSKAFVMPDMDVDVEVVLKPVSTYAFYVNDPANGSFYLEVDGSPVTRAAKGAKVTVVTKAEAGYEPTSLTISKHGASTTSPVTVFGSTFTMPGFDVDIDVTFDSQGNNIVILPALGGTAVAYKADQNLLTRKYSVTKSETIDEQSSGDLVALEAKPEAGYMLQGYDIVRSSDGLKVNAKANGGYYFFTMPKDGVMVTPIYTGSVAVNIQAEFYLDGAITAAGKYADCSFSITVDGDRAEFTKTGQNLTDTAVLGKTINAGSYVDIRYDSAEGVAFVKYDITPTTADKLTDAQKEEVAEMIEQMRNEANQHGYFQLPASDLITGYTIKAYFEKGSLPIGPAVITEGNGSVSFFTTPAFDMPMDLNDVTGAVLATLGTSVNSAKPNEEVYVLATPANGYKFDDANFQSKLKITRKDNGAPLELKAYGPVYDTRTNTIWAYQYSFIMPAAGVDINCAFDSKPFRLYMKCVDETGKDLTGLGLWQVAINLQPGVTDNSWFAPITGSTIASVEYGDYVTVAMTEAGWSKYDMVSFRIDGREYTDESLNYFYNFQMIDERAKDLEIVAVLRPKVPYSVGIHNLYTTYVDTTKGAAQFLILESPTGYSDDFRFNSTFNDYNIKALSYVNKAVTGDKVGIVVSSIDDKYTVKADDITIYALGSDADRIILNEEWISITGKQVSKDTKDAMRVFTFTMPDSDVYIGVNFTGAKNWLVVHVLDEKTDKAVENMVQVITNTTDNPVTYDVGTDFTFDDVSYNTQVSIVRSTQALAEGRVISKVDIHTTNNQSVPYTSLAAAGEGISFAMPDTPVAVYVYVSEPSYGLGVNAVYEVNNGSLVFRKSADKDSPTYELKKFEKGDTVFVFAEPDKNYDQLEPGDLQILANGVTNIANYVKEGVWSFTMPEGTIVFKADFEKSQAEERTIQIKVVNSNGKPLSDAKVKVKIGDYTYSFKNGDTLVALEKQTLNFSSDDGTILMIQSDSLKGIKDGDSYKVPTDLEENKSTHIWDVITITMKVPKNETVLVTIKADNNVTIQSSAVSGDFKKNTEGKTFELPVGTKLTITSDTTGLKKITLDADYGKVDGSVYTVPDKPQDELRITVTASSNPIKLDADENGTVTFYSDKDLKNPIINEKIKTGDTVYAKAAGNSGYVLNKFKVTEIVSKDEQKPEKISEGVYSFKMPAGGVTVTATFKLQTAEIKVLILDKKDIGNSITSAKGLDSLTAKGSIVVSESSEKDLDYQNGITIKPVAEQILKIPVKVGSYQVTTLKVFTKASDTTEGTTIKLNSNSAYSYTVTGSEKYLVLYVEKGTGTAAGSTGITFTGGELFGNLDAPDTQSTVEEQTSTAEDQNVVDEQVNTVDEQVNTVDEQVNTVDEQVNTVEEQVEVVEEQPEAVQDQPEIVDEQVEVVQDQPETVEEEIEVIDG